MAPQAPSLGRRDLALLQIRQLIRKNTKVKKKKSIDNNNYEGKVNASMQ